jgi:hypothetical protein
MKLADCAAALSTDRFARKLPSSKRAVEERPQPPVQLQGTDGSKYILRSSLMGLPNASTA